MRKEVHTQGRKPDKRFDKLIRMAVLQGLGPRVIHRLVLEEAERYNMPPIGLTAVQHRVKVYRQHIEDVQALYSGTLSLEEVIKTHDKLNNALYKTHKAVYLDMGDE